MTNKPLALLLEDELLIAVDVEMAFSQAGFSVVIFSRCTGAEEWLQRNTPRVAVIDVSLIDGPCTKAATLLVERNVPFLVHTARRRPADDVAPVFNAGTWLEKPADVEQIAAVVTKLSGLVTP